jgi:hypothetical protein
MSTQHGRSVEEIPLLTPTWLWTWEGVCFGYHRNKSLLTWDGMEVGRFSGAEVYGPDGRYLGEVRKATDENRLITSCYKKTSTRTAFVRTSERGYRRGADRPEEPLYCGFENFPLPKVLKGMIAELQKGMKSFANEC